MLFDRIARRASVARQPSARASGAGRRASARAVVEPVEARRHMDGSFATAVALGPVNGLVVKLDKVNTTDNKNDYFKFTVPQAGRLRVTLDGTGPGDADLYLYNAANAGAQIGSSTNDNVTEVIDKATVPAGTYYARVNGFAGGQTNYTLAVQTDFAGQTPGTARSVGTVNGTEKTFKDFIGNTDQQDYYKFNTSSNGLVALTLDGLTSDVDLQLYASDGTTLLKSSAKGGTNPELIYHGSPAATYYARVFQFNNTSNYTLHLKNAPLPADGAGNTLAAAKDLKTVGSTVSFDDAIVNKFDEADLYKFFVAEKGNIDVKLTGLTDNLKLELLDNNGLVTASSNNGASLNESITKLSNFGGTYYVRVTQGVNAGATGPASKYHLEITAPKDGGPNSLQTAKPLTFVNKQAVVSGFVGVNDKEDWYKVTVQAGKALTATLTGLTADADIQLVNSGGGVIDASLAGGTNSELVEGVSLPAGTYFLRVFNFKNNNAAYNLKVTTT